MSALQDYSINVAAKSLNVDPDVVQGGLKVGVVEWMALIEMIMAMVMKFMEQCQQPKPTLLTSIKNPTRLQRARFYNVVRDGFDDCKHLGWRRQARRFADTMLNDLPPDDTIELIVDECRGGF